MLGKPIFTLGDKVWFDFNGSPICGTIEIVDKWGTFEDDSDVSYDIFSNSENCLYKHIPESFVHPFNEK